MIYLPWGRDIINSLDLSTKNVAGGEMQERYTETGDVHNSRIFGIIGEGILNFGIWSFIFVFIVFAIIIKKMRMLILSIPIDDARFYIVPILIIVSILFLGSDFDNMLLTVVKRLVVPYFVLFVITRKRTDERTCVCL